MSEENKNQEESLSAEPSNVNAEPLMMNEDPPQSESELSSNESEQAVIKNQPSTNMEVHKHPHHITHKKKWGEYLLEFVMLFLAVFLGFLAENVREHQVEKEREKQYIESLVEDLKTDQQSLADHIATVKGGILMMDTLINQLSHPEEIAAHSGDVYYLARLAPRLKPLPISSRTYEQLKNSGNFRLIHNVAISNKIMSYYEKLPLIRLLESINETEFTQYKNVAAKIFDPLVLVQMEDNDVVKRIDSNPPLRTTDKEILQELSVFSVYMHGTKNGVLGSATALKTAGAELLAYLQKEYHLE